MLYTGPFLYHWQWISITFFGRMSKWWIRPTIQSLVSVFHLRRWTTRRSWSPDLGTTMSGVGRYRAMDKVYPRHSRACRFEPLIWSLDASLSGTVTVLISDKSGFLIVESCPVIKWSGLEMAFENWTIWMVCLVTWIDKAGPFYI